MGALVVHRSSARTLPTSVGRGMVGLRSKPFSLLSSGHEARGLGAASGYRLRHCMAVVEGGQAPGAGAANRDGHEPGGWARRAGNRRGGLTQDQQTWTCGGMRHGRDRNAAVNLKSRAASSAVTAPGVEGPGVGCRAGVNPDHDEARTRHGLSMKEMPVCGRAARRGGGPGKASHVAQPMDEQQGSSGYGEGLRLWPVEGFLHPGHV